MDNEIYIKQCIDQWCVFCNNWNQGLYTALLREERVDPCSRDSAGRRDYSADDIGWVKFIRHLKDTGMLHRDIV